MSDTQWDRWRSAITNGTRVETERGNPASGFYKQTTGEAAPRDIEAICICRDGNTLQCFRNVYGDGSRMDADAIDELFGKVCIYPISHEIYTAVTERGEPFPPEYGAKGRLTMKDQAAGVAWSPEYGRKRLGLDMPGAVKPSEMAGGAVHEPGTDAPENPRAVIGGNMPPEPMEAAGEAPSASSVDPAPVGYTFQGERTPELIMTEEVSALGAGVKTWLDSIGGAPRDKAEADIAADYKTKFAAIEKRADKARVDEKEPFLQGGRDVDARWKRPIANAKTSKEKCGAIAQEWRDAENARRQAEADKANKAARDAAEKAGQPADVAPAPIQAEKVGGLGNIRTVGERGVTRWQVDDPRAYATHLLAQEGDLPSEIVEALGKVASRRQADAPGVSKHTERKAA